MGFLRRLGGLVLLLILAPACDTTQPIQVGIRTLRIDISAVNALMETFFVYDIVEDVNFNGMPDDPVVGLWCIPIDPLIEQRVPPDSVPWSYSLEISVLRAGGREVELVSDVTSLNEFANIAPYHTKPPVTGITIPVQAPIVEAGKTFLFVSQYKASAADTTVMATTTNPITTIAPLTYGFGNGLCSEAFPGPATLDGVPPPFRIELDKGDTIIVKARKAETAPFSVLSSPALTARVVLDGRAVNVQGTETSGSGSAEGFSFSFTSQ